MKRLNIAGIALLVFLVSACMSNPSRTASTVISEPYRLDTGLESRAISFENITGERGKGAMASSPLGEGRKGSPAKIFAPGETVELANIQGPGTIRHIWMTTNAFRDTFRGMVIRAYWDGQEHPSIEAPIGDFFGFAHAKTGAFQSAAHSVGEKYAMNFWLPMPFTKSARITLTNELPDPKMIYFQIDYTVGDNHPADVGRMHISFQRSNPTELKKDFEILPYRQGKGRFLGTVLGIRPSPHPKMADNWWGEGEMKVYMDGDTDFPTIAGTGAEDYVALSYGIQQTPHLYHGANYVHSDAKGDYNDDRYVSMYRWHLKDPIYWHEDVRITIQQMGCCKISFADANVKTMDEAWSWYMNTLYERQDDWSAAAFWYEPIPSTPLPPMPDLEARLANLPK